LLVSLNIFVNALLTLLLFFLLDVADDRADTRSFGKLILELVHLGGILRVIQVNGGLKFLNL
jgi:hypothetical protein